MQSHDEQGRLVQTGGPFSMDDKEKISELLRKAETLGAVSHVIGQLPKKGQKVTINGLNFFVKGVNEETGELHLKLATPED